MIEFAIFFTLIASTISQSPANGRSCMSNEVGIDYIGGDIPNNVALPGYTVDTCKQRCLNNTACNAFAFVTVDNTCWLRSYGYTRLNSPTRTSALCNLPVSQCATVEQGIDYAGADLPLVAVPNIQTLTQCSQKCTMAPGCTVYSWVPSSLTCYLRASWFTSRFDSETVISGRCTPPTTPKTCLDPEQGINYAGGDIPNQPITGLKSQADCAQKCITEYACTAYVWQTTDNTCWLKNDAYTRTSDSTKISGLCMTPACSVVEQGIDYGGGDLPGGLTYYVRTITECGQMCKATAGCVAYVWLSFENSCWLKGSGYTSRFDSVTRIAGRCDQTTTAAPVTSASTASTAAPVASTMSCLPVEQGIDYIGGDLPNGVITGLGSIADCGQKCMAAAGCTAYVWVTVDNSCWLKKGGYTRIQSPTRNSVLCMNSSCGTPEMGIDYWGGDLPNGVFTGITSLNDCSLKCQATAGCAIYVWLSFDNSCWLKQSSGWNRIDSPSRISGRCVTAPPTSSAGTGCGTPEVGIDYINGDLPNSVIQNVNTPAECSQRCVAAPGCTAWVLVTSDNSCWLKKGGYTRIQSSTRTGGLCMTSNCGPAEFGIDYWGGDLPNGVFTNVTSLSDCSQKCQTTPGCAIFVWLSFDNSCWLKKSSGWTRISSVTRISGRCDQGNSTTTSTTTTTTTNGGTNAGTNTGASTSSITTSGTTINTNTVQIVTIVQILSGMHMSGSQIISTTTGKTLMDCATACAAQKLCNSFSYNQISLICELNSVTAAKGIDMQSNGGFVIYQLQTNPTTSTTTTTATATATATTTTAAQTMTIQQMVSGMHMSGSQIILTISGKGLTDCAAACAAQTLCSSFSYNANAKTCELNSVSALQGTNMLASSGFIIYQLTQSQGLQFQQILAGKHMGGSQVISSTSGKGLNDCAAACLASTSCYSFSYNQNSMICELNSVGAAQGFNMLSNNGFSIYQLPQSTRASITTTTTVTSKSCTVEQDTDYFGGDFASLKNIISVTDCTQTCLFNTSCVAYTYSPSSKTCFLKGNGYSRTVSRGSYGGGCNASNSGSSSSSSSSISSSSSGSSTTTTTTTVTSKSCTVEQDIDYYGGDFAILKNTISVTNCTQTCFINTACIAYTYNPSSKNCYIKGNGYSRTSSPGNYGGNCKAINSSSSSSSSGSISLNSPSSSSSSSGTSGTSNSGSSSSSSSSSNSQTQVPAQGSSTSGSANSNNAAKTQEWQVNVDDGNIRGIATRVANAVAKKSSTNAAVIPVRIVSATQQVTPGFPGYTYHLVLILSQPACGSQNVSYQQCDVTISQTPGGTGTESITINSCSPASYDDYLGN